MNQAAMMQWSRWLAIAWLGALLAACSDSHPGDGEGAGLGPKNSTETGNPPVIELERVALVNDDGALHVVGERRAVVPGGGEIEVERLATGARVTGDVAADGSFDVRVEGSLRDAYQLRARAAAGAKRSEPVFVGRDGATAQADALCAECDLPEVRWGGIGATLGTAHLLTGCSQYTAVHTVGEQCNNQLPCASSGGEREWTLLDLQSRLGEPEVVSALQTETYYGKNTGAGPGFSVTIGGGAITLFDEPCDGEADCEEAPPAVRALRELLDAIAEQQACSEICADQPELVFVAEACVECYPDDARCISRAPVCATPCEDAGDCAAEAGACNPEGYCEQVVCE